MTHITVYKNGNRYSIKLNGHANYAPNGQDIVCAATSMITFMLLQMIDNMNARNEVSIVTQKQEEGFVNIEVSVGKIYQDYFDTVLDVILTGYKLLSNKYPNNIFLETDINSI
jgi:hypothetical protein|nr:MAG TPA: YsxB-like protein [Caudoviricetes sp.]